MLLLMAPVAWSDDGPRTGYFRKSITPLELLGEEGANAIASVFAADEKLTWQLSVPKTYDPAKPAAVMVFIGFAEWGGGKKEWSNILEDHNIIWIGLINGGDKEPPKIDLVRQNRYMFMCGSKDKDRRKMQQIAASYKAAGVVNTELVTVANVNRQMPGSSYFERAIEFLDARPQASKEAK